MSAAKLSAEEIAQHLGKLPGWSNQNDALTKTYTFKNFTGAMQFVNLVAETAEVVQHHPDIEIRYTKVTLTLSTHDAGGVTQKDVDSAASADDYADTVAQ